MASTDLELPSRACLLLAWRVVGKYASVKEGARVLHLFNYGIDEEGRALPRFLLPLVGRRWWLCGGLGSAFGNYLPALWCGSVLVYLWLGGM